MTDEEIRIAVGAAIVRSGWIDSDDMDPLQWHPCDPQCSRKCGCSGVPYVSDRLWQELKPIFDQIRGEESS